MRYLGLDYGSKTIGIAITDELNIAPTPRETLFRNREHMLRSTCAKISDIVRENDITTIVIGLPLNMDGTIGERVEKCQIFAKMLSNKVDVPIVWQDERLTTIKADELLSEYGIDKEDRKKYIDSISACIILQDYMNNQKRGDV